MKSPITTHILDLSKGCPAKDVKVILYIRIKGKWKLLNSSKTNSDGRVENLIPEGGKFKKGSYKLCFDIEKYLGKNAFFNFIQIEFKITNSNRNYHIPLLLNKFGYSTYRGS